MKPDYNLLLNHYKTEEIRMIKQINKYKRPISVLNKKLDDCRVKKEKCLEMLKKGK